MAKPRHGHTVGYQRSPTWRSWRAARQRCQRHPKYLGKWTHAPWNRFEVFLRDMGEKPEGATLDRIDNERGYEPTNCRWATYTEQIRNRGVTKLDEVAAMQIRWLYLEGGFSQPKIAHAFNIGRTTVGGVVRDERWKVSDPNAR